MTHAWMLRNDGKAFGCTLHFYGMGDEDLSSEAEVAAFLIKTQSKDIDLAEFVLDAWLARLVENSVSYNAEEPEIEQAIRDEIANLPYHFQYALTPEELIAIHRKLNNYTNVGDMYDFIDATTLKLLSYQKQISDSLNQQFTRVRFGGQYDTAMGNNTLWFRISSVGFNWADIIYQFVSDYRRRLHVDYVTIVRDYESDNGNVDGKSEYIYKARDGQPYFEMPIEEYLAEEHENSPVFSAVEVGRGPLTALDTRLGLGDTFREAQQEVERVFGYRYPHDFKGYFLHDEHLKCVEGSEFFDNAPTVTKRKLLRVKSAIKEIFPEIDDVEFDLRPRENSKGNMVGFDLDCTVSSESSPNYDGVNVSLKFSKALSQITVDMIVRNFRIEWTDYKKFSK